MDISALNRQTDKQTKWRKSWKWQPRQQKPISFKYVFITALLTTKNFSKNKQITL